MESIENCNPLEDFGGWQNSKSRRCSRGIFTMDNGIEFVEHCIDFYIKRRAYVGLENLILASGRLFFSVKDPLKVF